MKTYGALVVATSLVLTSGLVRAQSLSALSEYSVITSGNLVSSRDIEGRTLVGGNLTSGNSSNFGIHMSSGTPASDRVLIVQGDILNGGPLNVQRGSVAVGGSVVGGRIINYNGGGSLVHNTTDYSSIFTQLNMASTTLKNTAANSIVIIPGASAQPTGVVFNAVGDSNGLAVFNINAASLFSNDKVQAISFTSNGATDIVINVAGSSVNWNSGSNLTGNFTSTDWRGNIVWNFYEATSVDFGSHNMMGQVIAPNAVVKSSNNIDGSVYALSLDSNGEVHFPGYDGNIKLVPEPSAALLGALGALFLLRRRR